MTVHGNGSGLRPLRQRWWAVFALLTCLLAAPSMAWCSCEGGTAGKMSAGHTSDVQVSGEKAPVEEAAAPEEGAKQADVKKKEDASAVSKGAAEAKPFNMDELIERLKKSDAIGFLTKLTLRSDALDLVGMVKAYKEHKSRYSLADLHARFNGLLLKVLALLSDDPKLSKDISVAREDIWKSLLEVKA